MPSTPLSQRRQLPNRQAKLTQARRLKQLKRKQASASGTEDSSESSSRSRSSRLGSGASSSSEVVIVDSDLESTDDDDSDIEIMGPKETKDNGQAGRSETGEESGDETQEQERFPPPPQKSVWFAFPTSCCRHRSKQWIGWILTCSSFELVLSVCLRVWCWQAGPACDSEHPQKSDDGRHPTETRGFQASPRREQPTKTAETQAAGSGP